ncbi:MAG: hypothetical protein QXS93_03305 [Candidatus Micrarchaeia archaeon]
MGRISILIALLMLGSMALSFAWTEYTSATVAKLVLLESYPECAAQIEEGAILPYKEEQVDPVLKEPVNFHCDTLTCPAFDPKYCQTSVKTCQSETMAGKMKNYAKKACNCEQAKLLAQAITYYIAKYNPMNLMVNEECRDEFNNELEKAIRSGQPQWEVRFQCNAPNREFVFTSQRYNEMLYNARTFAFAEAYSGSQPWFCYTLGKPGNGAGSGLKNTGALCAKNSECKSGRCSNNVCCDADICCPVPGVKGYPCGQGEKCSSDYTCVPVNARNGEKCDYNEECQSGNCRPGSGASVSTRYCCGAGNEFCCASNSDCASGHECKNYACVAKPFVPQSNNTPGEEEQKSQGCLPIAVLLAVVGGLFIYDRGLGRR